MKGAEKTVAKKEVGEDLLAQIMPDLSTRYGYVLASKNEPRGMVYDENGRPRKEIEYKPYLNVILRSSIVWPLEYGENGKPTGKGKQDPFSGKERRAGKHILRYYDGCTTLFMDDQPKEKDVIDNFVNGTRDVILTNGRYFVYGYDFMLKLYLDWCSYNEASPYRVPTADVKFKPIDSEKDSEKDSENLDKEDKARGLANSAPSKKMLIHAKYMGISFEDMETGQPLSEKVIRTEYRKVAKSNPVGFLESYNDKTIETKTWIREAIEAGQISTVIMPNKAAWGNGSIILDISGIKSLEMIVDKLTEFTQTEDGFEFLDQLKTLYS